MLVFVIVNFTRQHDGAMGCPDIVLGCACGGVSARVSIWTTGLRKADCPPQCGWAASNHSGPHRTKGEEEFAPAA